MTGSIVTIATSAVLALVLAGCGASGAIPTPSAPGGPAGSGNPAGPGSPTPAGPPAGSIDSCALLSDQEIETATGHRVTERSPSMLTRVFPSMCDIVLEVGGSLTIGSISSGGRSMYQDSFEPFYIDEAVSGLGDKAGYADGELMVLKDDVLFDIIWYSSGRSDVNVILRYLAEVILAKLPCLAQGCPGLTLPPAPPSRAPALDACSLLTEKEIEDATGIKVSGEATFAFGGNAVCSRTLESSPLDHVKLTLMEVGGRAEFDRWAQAYEPPLEHLPGLGDDAMKTGTIPGGTFYAVVGDRLLTLSFSLPRPDDDPYANYAKVEPLVGIALLRLP